MASYLAVITLYISVVVIGAWLYDGGHKGVSENLRIAVIIPAHDEERGIVSTVSQLLDSDYPRSSFSVFVIADNCSDATAERGEYAGATVLIRNDPDHRGKGQALDWALRRYSEALRQFDLIAFIDADMNVDRGFMRHMAHVFADQAVVAAQCRYIVANPGDGFLSAMGFASFCFANHVRPAGRCWLGGSAELKGSGMVFRTPFLLARGWSAQSIAEDMQFGKQLLLEGVLVRYVPRAIVTSPIPSTLKQVAVQQSRWEGGKKQVVREMFPKFLAALVQRRSVALLDGLLDMLVAPVAVVIMLSVIGAIISSLPGAAPISIFSITLIVFSIAIVTGLVQNKAPLAVYLRLAAAPAFLFWKLWLVAKVSVMPSNGTWQRTPRDR